MTQLANWVRYKSATRNPQPATIKPLLAFLFALTPTFLSAQEDVPMADAMRSEGKIYVVVAVALVILLGLFGYLFLLDRKVSRIEKEIDL